MNYYPIKIAGIDRKLPICRVTDDLYIGAFVIFGDAELTVAAAKALLDLALGGNYVIIFGGKVKKRRCGGKGAS